jgi:hypothetical protein
VIAFFADGMEPGDELFFAKRLLVDADFHRGMLKPS